MPPQNFNAFTLAAALLCSAPVLWPVKAEAQSNQDQSPEVAQTPAFGFHAQATYIWQRKPSFNAAYTGTNSLIPGREKLGVEGGRHAL